MCNMEIISNAAQQAGIYYNGANLKTFAEWKKENKIVKKGEKAILQVPLWKNVAYKDKESGEVYNKFIKNNSVCLFAEWQVIPITASNKAS